jgi:acetyltransferase
MEANAWPPAAAASRTDPGRKPPGHGPIRMRPTRMSDIPRIRAFVRNLSPESRRRRFFAPISELSAQQLERLTCTSSADELGLLALDRETIVAMAQCAATGNAEAEVAVVVADDWQRRGLGISLLRKLIIHARSRRLRLLGGLVLADNWAMLELAAKLGFSLIDEADPALVRIEMVLADDRPLTRERTPDESPAAAWLVA